MSSYPYLEAPEKIPNLFEAVIKAKTPDKFTYRFLESLGFTSSQERELLPFLKSLGFLGTTSRPAPEYDVLKNPQEFNNILQQKIKTTYRPLLHLDEKAPERSKDVLSGYFGQLTGEGLLRCENYAETFLSLVSLAKIDEEEKEELRAVKNYEEIKITFNINLPETEKEEVYQAIFKGLADLIKR